MPPTIKSTRLNRTRSLLVTYVQYLYCKMSFVIVQYIIVHLMEAFVTVLRNYILRYERKIQNRTLIILPIPESCDINYLVNTTDYLFFLNYNIIIHHVWNIIRTMPCKFVCKIPFSRHLFVWNEIIDVFLIDFVTILHFVETDQNGGRRDFPICYFGLRIHFQIIGKFA